MGFVRILSVPQSAPVPIKKKAHAIDWHALLGVNNDYGISVKLTALWLAVEISTDEMAWVT